MNENTNKTPWWKKKPVWIAAGAIVAASLIINWINPDFAKTTQTEKPAALEVQKPAEKEKPAEPEAKPEPEPEPPAEPEPSRAPDAPVTLDNAKFFCREEAEKLFIYGGKVHTLAGERMTDFDGENHLMLFDATFKNEYGTKVKGQVYCEVGGTNANPVLTFINITS